MKQVGGAVQMHSHGDAYVSIKIMNRTVEVTEMKY